MPKQPMNYQNNVIYKIQHKTIDELIYIGSTTNFAKRKWCHKSNCYNENNTEYKTKKYVMIRENGGWDMFDMILVKKYPCNDYLEAFAEEERMRRELNANMNGQRCFTTQEEREESQKHYRETHKEQKKVVEKKYYETNKERLLEYQKQYGESHREKIKERTKQYYETNKEVINERRRKKYETDKQSYHEKKKESIECDCGCIITYSNLTRHKKTTKHLELISRKTT